MENSFHLTGALARLNQIGAAINRLGEGDQAGAKAILCLILESAAEFTPGAYAAIYTFEGAEYDIGSATPLTAPDAPAPGEPRRWMEPARRAVKRGQAEFSYEEAGQPGGASGAGGASGCIPLMVSGETLGLLCLYRPGPPDFADLELLLLDNLAHLSAATLASARQLTLAQQEQARKEKELRRLRRAGMLISSRSSLKGTLEIILSMALEVMDARYGIFRLVDPAGKHLITHAVAGEYIGQPAVEALPIDEKSVMGQVAMRGEPLMIPDLRQEPWDRVYYPLDHQIEMRSELAVPLIGASGRLEGVLNLESPQVNAFDKQDRYILQILATQAVIAIQEIRLLDALQDISDLLLTQPLQNVLQELVHRACDLLNMPVSLIWLREKDELVLGAATDPALCGRRVALEESLAGRAILTGQPVTCLDGCSDREHSYPDLALLNVTGSALVAPLLASQDNSPLGAFSVYTSQTDFRDFDQSEWYQKILSILGHYAVLAVQNTAHQETLRHVQEQRAVAEAFAAVGDIATNLMHSLNNKIGTIPVRVEGIQDKCQAALEADPYLAMNLFEIDQSAGEAMEIVRESLFHLHPIQLAPVNIAACVQEAIAATRIPAGVQVRTWGLEGLPAVQAGPKRLAFVFANLIENAIDAMGSAGLAEGRIEIHAVSQEDGVQVSLHDSGPGIPPELHERIFEFNYSTRSAERPGKLGFGLWWVKTIMARFGGTVAVESDGRMGTTFVLSFPSGKGEA